ncbi:HAMP domain-containing sensor histidine kinase [Streptomyces sp. DSM 3412]|uniref:histidine kinase n=1 Tax=Streptomyces gottesmaniae TaxID=3075518 RepID=A0ABU2YQU5_9ACTN|nr:HAMP domain-containing sensor histidine kinase [Streptomyces sp. DSM 3412]MDT0566660.1 HAMP domain-containing sensor histidine kinase [Streptomyces sp. DSM 3412]
MSGVGDPRSRNRGPGGAQSRKGASPLGGVRPFSIKTKLGALVVISVLITTGLSMIAVHTKTELRFITVFSMIATLLITQFVAHSLTAPLDEMNAVARSISRGDYTRRVSENRRDELGDLAHTINLMADELEAQDRQRKELVANVSHELRTPIAGLRAVLENIVDGVTQADPETMRTALKQTERLGRLVETLLDLSRLDNGVVPLRRRRFEVWPYLSGVLKEAQMVSSARGGVASDSGKHTRTDVHLHLDVHPPELTANADPERIHQVVANLIDNAVKHSPAHGRVTVKARRGPTAESLELEVLDEGPGIPESEWHRVFERFNRGAVSSPHGPGSDGGTGLGLAIARWAVDLHGGRIGVAESPKGCRIQVILPGVPAKSQGAVGV